MFRRNLFVTIRKHPFWSGPASGAESFQVMGTAYEMVTKGALEKDLGLEAVSIVGGKGDAGIDMIARWRLGDSLVADVIVQCKRVKRKASPSLIRDFEGAILGSNAKPNLIGMIVSTMPPSDDCRVRLQQSKLNLMYLQMPEDVFTAAFTSFALQNMVPLLGTNLCRRVEGDDRLEFHYDGINLRL